MNKNQNLLEKARSALSNIHNGDSDRELINDKTLRKLECNGKSVEVEVELGYPAKTQLKSFRQRIQAALSEVPGLGKPDISITSKIAAHQAPPGAKRIPGVKNVIAVSSARGGVGMTTTTVNLALALAEEGAKVGLLDADIYDHSIPPMLGIAGRQATSEDGCIMEPLTAYGIKTMSVGFFLETEAPISWRSPMVIHALEQLLFGTRWDDLDYLLIDLPSGTGEVQLSILQKAPISGALLVTTPQDIVLKDIKKYIRLFEKNGISLLGIMENMSIHICQHCGQTEHIFGSGGSEKISSDFNIDCLGWLPIDMQIRKAIDEGCPTMVSAPTSRAADIYRSVARQMTARLALCPEEASEN